MSCDLNQLTTMFIYMCRVSTMSCDDGYAEDNYFEFNSRDEADAYAATYEDVNAETSVHKIVAPNDTDIPF